MSLKEEALIDLFNSNYEFTLFLLCSFSSSRSRKRQRNSHERSLTWYLPWPPLLLAGLNWLPILLLYICTADQELEKYRQLCIADQSRAKEQLRRRMLDKGVVVVVDAN